jgi:hypothetical protein
MTHENERTLSLYSESREAYPELMVVTKDNRRRVKAVLRKNCARKESKRLHQQRHFYFMPGFALL